MKKNLNSRQALRALRARRSLMASAAVLAMGVAAPALADMVHNGSYSMGVPEGAAAQSLSLSDYVMWITTPQVNTRQISSSQPQ